MVGHNIVYTWDKILFSCNKKGKIDLCPSMGDPENTTLIIRETRPERPL